jgi:cysteine desulfurase/selenocysteine lyase
MALLPSAFCFTQISQRYSSNNRLRSCWHTHGMVLGDPQVSNAEILENEDEWWVNYKFQHAHVAETTRPDFIILSTTIGDEAKPLVYLDSAATSQKPKQVIDTLSNYYNKINANVHRGAHTLSREATEAFEAARDTIASFVHANSRNEIVFTSGATEAINLVASSYGLANLKPGDEIVLSEMEHHSNLVPWQLVAESTGAVLRFVKANIDTGGLDLEQMKSLLNAKTKIVGFQHVSNVMGCINPVRDMVAMIRSNSPDAIIILDACQSVPHMKVDVQDLGVDFLAASGHKMCAPTGIGFLWGKEDILNSMPPYMGGGEMIDQVTLEGSTFAKAPARFEAGTPPIAQAVGLGAAIKYLEEVGMDNVAAYEHEIGEYLHRRLSEVKGVKVLGPPVGSDRAAVCSFVVDSVHPSDLSTFLDMEGIAIRAGHHCCQPLHQALNISHSARASLYIYNTKE